MPVIHFEGPVLTQEQRENLIREFTDVVVKNIPNIPRDAYFVFLDEYPDDKVGIGGLVLPKHIEKMGKPKE
jgi:4-oxalocrotonate tautomerase family enzyme